MRSRASSGRCSRAASGALATASSGGLATALSPQAKVAAAATQGMRAEAGQTAVAAGALLCPSEQAAEGSIGSSSPVRRRRTSFQQRLSPLVVQQPAGAEPQSQLPTSPPLHAALRQVAGQGGEEAQLHAADASWLVDAKAAAAAAVTGPAVSGGGTDDLPLPVPPARSDSPAISGSSAPAPRQGASSLQQSAPSAPWPQPAASGPPQSRDPAALGRLLRESASGGASGMLSGAQLTSARLSSSLASFADRQALLAAARKVAATAAEGSEGSDDGLAKQASGMLRSDSSMVGRPGSAPVMQPPYGLQKRRVSPGKTLSSRGADGSSDAFLIAAHRPEGGGSHSVGSTPSRGCGVSPGSEGASSLGGSSRIPRPGRCSPPGGSGASTPASTRIPRPCES